MNNGINFECVKEITRELKKRFKGMQSNSYGYCCNSDYDAYHKYINENDYVCAKIFKGGLNNQYRYDSYYECCYWDIGKVVFFGWRLKEFDFKEVIKVMQEVATKYNYEVVEPKDVSECIKLKMIGE